MTQPFFYTIKKYCIPRGSASLLMIVTHILSGISDIIPLDLRTVCEDSLTAPPGGTAQSRPCCPRTQGPYSRVGWLDCFLVWHMANLLIYILHFCCLCRSLLNEAQSAFVNRLNIHFFIYFVEHKAAVFHRKKKWLGQR